MASEVPDKSRWRLGFWNRLAIVAGSLYVVGYPTWRVLAVNEERSKIASEGYQNCISSLSVDGPAAGITGCGDIWQASAKYLGWQEWFILSGIALVIALIAYALGRVSVMVAKWVWRGRAI